MKNKLIIALTLITLMSFSTTHISAYSKKTQKSIAQNNLYSAKATKAKQKKPEYYRPGHSDGLQNYPGKTIDAGMNTGMLPTNSASHSGNDISF
jgi:hypothetical protein